MAKERRTGVAIRRRDGSDLSRVGTASVAVPNPSAVVLQALLAELKSVKEQLQTSLARRPSSEPANVPPQETTRGASERVRPSMLRQIVD